MEDNLNCDFANGCIIEQLIKTPFSRRISQDKTIVRNLPCPTPTLGNLTSKYISNKKEHIRKFSRATYDRFEWLCGCEKLNGLFCWPCILFHKSSENKFEENEDIMKKNLSK